MFVGSMGCQGFLALKNKASMWKSYQVLQDLEGLFKLHHHVLRQTLSDREAVSWVLHRTFKVSPQGQLKNRDYKLVF